MREADEEIREIKKEIIESRGLIIKTNNLVNSLGADIKSIAKRQAGYERRFNWNGVAAYVLFTALVLVGVRLASDAEIGAIEERQEDLTRTVVELRQELAEATRQAERRSRAETRAARFYELIRQQKRQEVVEGYEQLRREELTAAEAAFFRDIVDQFRLDLSVAAYQEGLDLMRTGRYEEARSKFRESIDYADHGTHIPAVKYHLARALRRLNRQPEAMVHASSVVEQDTDPDLQDDAMWLYAQCAEELDQIDEARDALRTIGRRWPRSEFAADARRKLGELNLRVLRGGTNRN